MTPEQMQNRIRTALDLQKRGHEKYHEWVHQMIVISTGSLAILVGMQSNLVPEEPYCLWLLQSCWILLSLAIASGAVVLHGEHQILDQLSRNFLRQVSDAGDGTPDATGGMTSAKPTLATQWCRIIFPWSLAASLAMLAVFASLNTGRHRSKQPDETPNTHRNNQMARPNPS